MRGAASSRPTRLRGHVNDEVCCERDGEAGDYGRNHYRAYGKLVLRYAWAKQDPRGDKSHTQPGLLVWQSLFGLER